MSTDRDTTRIVRSWLRTDEHESAEHILDVVLERVDTTPQRRTTWWPARRLPHMNNTVRIAMAAAAVVIVAIAGISLLGPGSNIGGPQVTPSPTPTPQSFPDGGPNLSPGRYVVDEPFPVRITFEVPEGWFSWISNADVAGLVVDNGVGDGGSGWGTTFWIVENVYVDPCDLSSELDPPLGPSVDDLVTALTSLPGYESTAPADVTVSGFSGVEFELTAPDYGEECAGHRTWRTAGSEPRAMLPGETNRVRVLDVDGVRLVEIIVEYAHTTEYEQALGIPYDPDAHVADQPELRQMLDSIRIESRP